MFWPSSTTTQNTPALIPTFKIYEDFDKIIAKEVCFTETGEKRIVKLLHFPNINPDEQNRLLMSSDSGQSEDEEHQQSGGDNNNCSAFLNKQRKKSSSKRVLDMQRKISLNKLSEVKNELNNHKHNDGATTSSSNSTMAQGLSYSSIPLKTLKSDEPRKKCINKNKIISPLNPQNHFKKMGQFSGYEQYKMSLLEVPSSRDYCEPSSDDLSSEWDSDVPDSQVNASNSKESKPLTGWRKLRNIVQWTPFFQTHKNNKRYAWIQLAGHQGNFKAGLDPGTVQKRLTPNEELCFQKLMNDVLRPYVPEYRGIVIGDDGESQYIQLQDLLSDFMKPCCVMDCKIGKTYLEEELLKAKDKQKLRKDMYEKMVQIDINAPNDEEHKAKGVTKPRYMVWRETISSTATLGFRIEGIKKDDGSSSKDFKTIKRKEDIMEMFKGFTEKHPNALTKYIQRLKAIRATLECSEFFKSHEVIGSSLLFIHDDNNTSVWLIDFAKTKSLPVNTIVTHSSKWEIGNHEDGYLIGLNNIIDLFTAVNNSNNQKITCSDSSG
ncbi:unnamed protein product [Diamesa hyperborea]